MKSIKQLRVLIVVLLLFGLVAAVAGCGRRTGSTATNAESTATAGSGNRTTVKLDYADITATVGDGSLAITNTSNETWTNVRLTLDRSFTGTLKEILPQQTVVIPAGNFTRDGESIDPSLIGHGLVFEMTCDLPGNREGTFFTMWH
jgi:hypothetical protein